MKYERVPERGHRQPKPIYKDVLNVRHILNDVLSTVYYATVLSETTYRLFNSFCL